QAPNPVESVSSKMANLMGPSFPPILKQLSNTQTAEKKTAPVRLRSNSYALVPNATGSHLMGYPSSGTEETPDTRAIVPQPGKRVNGVHVVAVTLSYLLPMVRGSPQLWSEILEYIDIAIRTGGTVLLDMVGSSAYCFVFYASILSNM
ncbi:hypothetical protein SARC_15466, partial [Sphaeroforma arctica JP610]